MNYLRKGFIILAGILLISCKKENYVLYSVDNACDSVVINQTGRNKYQFITKGRTFDGRIIKDKDSVRIMELDRGPNSKLNKLILKNERAYYPGMIDVDYFIVKKTGEKDITLSDSKWALLKHCGSSMESFKKFRFNKKEHVFEFDRGYTYVFTYKTKDSLHYKLYLKTIITEDLETERKMVYDPDFVSAEVQLIASNIVRAQFYGMKVKDSTLVYPFDYKSDKPQNVYFYKYEK
ncbi:hypothetical protein [Chryseobacterium vaccae]|uniref:hypothetical protein n=1 Tax=Chryseobacterium vaccae TaxID=2604424 RepID=UPI0012948920|nr:hypothetical protein [Chryseobacterium vaccae]